MNPTEIWSVFRFECGRTMTVPRLATWSLLALFPVGLLAMIQLQGGQLEKDARGGIVLFVLIPELVCIMGLLLWAAPIIYAELEGKTWAYLAVSPAGKGSILLGKYLTAVCWTALTAWLSLAISLVIVHPESDAMPLAASLAALVLLACLAYGALYTFLGVLFLKRALVLAVAYTLLSEVLISFIPAVINQLTVQYHLRCLLIKWLGWEQMVTGSSGGLQISQQLFGDAPPLQHILILLGYTGVLLLAAVAILRRRELVNSERQ